MGNCECGGKHQHQPCIGVCGHCGQCGYKHRPDCDEGKLEPTENDRDPSNVELRAGYIMGMAMRLPLGDDRMFLMRAARSLRAYAEDLRRKPNQ